MKPPVGKACWTIDDALIFADRLFEDNLRAFKTALVTTIPARGADVDHEFFDDLFEEKRREWVTRRAEIRRELTAWLAEHNSGGEAKVSG